MSVVSKILKHSTILWSGSILGDLEVMASHKEVAQALFPWVGVSSLQVLQACGEMLGCSSGTVVAVVPR